MMSSSQEQAGKPARERGRGWLFSFAAILMWEAVVTLIMWISYGPPSGDALYYSYGPMMLVIFIFGGPLTYLAAWRKPKPYWGVMAWALPVFLVCWALASRSV